MTDDTFSVRRIISEIISETSLSDPREIAQKAVAMIPPDQQGRLLATLLVAEVRTALAEHRNTAMSKVFQNRNAPVPPVFKPAAPKPAPAEFQPARTRTMVEEPPAYRPNRSTKVAGIRDWWAETLKARVFVGDAGWMPLGECTARELEYAEKARREKAERETNRAKMYFALRRLLEEYGVETVAQLPENAARAAMS